jgi:hypothetical protein
MQAALFTPAAGVTRVGRFTPGQRMAAGQVYAGRPNTRVDPRELAPRTWGWLGNPYSVRKHGRDALRLFLEDFQERIARDQRFRSCVARLKGYELLCFCTENWDTSLAQHTSPEQLLPVAKCHAQLIALIVDAMPGIP